MELNVRINGTERSFPGLAEPAPLAGVVEALGLKADRIAIEHNGEIASRTNWPDVQVRSGDRLEIVHFVGGGTVSSCPSVAAATPPSGRRTRSSLRYR
jgi:sulfur carrier protein